MTETSSAGISVPDSDALALPEAVELSTGSMPENAVIWLHGLGADGHDFESAVPMLEMERVGATRFVFPHAPLRPVTLNGGMQMRAWYDIKGMSVSRDQDEEGIAHSMALVHALIAREISRGIPSSRIVLAGFSQGGALAAHVALRHPQKLAGLMVLSGYLLFPDRLLTEIRQANRNTAVFVAHGSMDPMVPVAMGRDLARRLEQLQLAVEWHEYPMQHSVIREELLDMGAWLRTRMAALE